MTLDHKDKFGNRVRPITISRAENGIEPLLTWLRMRGHLGVNATRDAHHQWLLGHDVTINVVEDP